MSKILSICILMLSVWVALNITEDLPDMLESRDDCLEVLHNPEFVTVVRGTNTAPTYEVCNNFTNYRYYGAEPYGFDIEYVNDGGKKITLKIRDPHFIEMQGDGLIIYV